MNAAFVAKPEREDVGRPHVEERRIERIDLLDRRGRGDERAAVQLHDPLEVRRPGRAHVGGLARELLGAARREHRIEPPLEADRRRGLRAHRGSAERAGDVAGVHLDAVRQLEQPLQARVEVAGAVGGVDGEIRARGVPDEQRVARQHEPRIGGAAAVDDDEAAVLRAMAGRVHDAQHDLAGDELVPVRQVVVLVLGAGRRVHRDRDPVLEREAAVTGHVVGVRVRLERPDDADALLLGGGEVVVDLVGRIDQERFVGLSVPDQVRRAAEVGVDELAEDHERDATNALHFVS
jgi:hypothetical protein